jgi:hypothetical protein
MMEKHSYIVGKTIGNYKFPTTALRELFKAGFRMVRMPNKQLPGHTIVVGDELPSKSLIVSPMGWVNLVRPV